MNSVYIAIGSNLKKPLEQIKNAFILIREIDNINILKTSRIYWSHPLGTKNQPDFANCVILISTELSPHNLLKELQDIEKTLGKKTIMHWGPRTIDLDILLYDNLVLNSKDLIIPHPEVENRDFVLLPLNDINPNLILPNNKTVKDYIKNCINKLVYSNELLQC
jgi:2-amino-4-hydroxy-6-hydroxymethyldihydropteridine diphosphokinase